VSHCYSPGCSGGAEPRRTCKRRDRTAALALADPNRIALCVRADCRDWLADAVRQELRPRLAEQGFRGSGATFVLPSHSHFATVGLQKSQLSHRETLKFTANVTVVAKYVWLSLRDAKPHLPIREPNTRYGGEVWQRRIGKLLPDGKTSGGQSPAKLTPQMPSGNSHRPWRCMCYRRCVLDSARATAVLPAGCRSIRFGPSILGEYT
jgi:hypothetical protein